MVHIYKKSASPLKPWNVMRSAGVNNIGIATKQKYLVLWNADVVRKDGMWHYVFDFDTRSSLEKSEIAQLMAGDGEQTSYEDKADWAAFLGGDFEVISGVRRNQITRSADNGAGNSGEVKISCMRMGNSQFPLPQCA